MALYLSIWLRCCNKNKPKIFIKCPILLIIKILDQWRIFWVFSCTLVVDVLWRQSMLQTNGCDHKGNAYN